MAARSAKNTPANSDLGAIVAAAVAAALADIPGAGIVVEADEPKPKSPAKSPAKPKPKRQPKPKPGIVTCEIAWNLLGADPEYAPANPAKPATAPQLWRLNSDGLLADAIALAK